MKKKTVYECSYCGSLYDTEKEAEGCEAFHKKVIDIAHCRYNKPNMVLTEKDGNPVGSLPCEIVVKTTVGDISYVRKRASETRYGRY